jgi:hypothetical protein
LDDGDLVVSVDHPVAVCLVDPADADHAVGVEFCGAQRAHAGGADDRDAFVQKVQKFLVPDGGDLVPQSVDDEHRVAGPGMAQHVAVPYRWVQLGGGQDPADAGGGDRRPGVHMDCHAAVTSCTWLGRGMTWRAL